MRQALENPNPNPPDRAAVEEIGVLGRLVAPTEIGVRASRYLIEGELSACLPALRRPFPSRTLAIEAPSVPAGLAARRAYEADGQRRRNEWTS